MIWIKKNLLKISKENFRAFLSVVSDDGNIDHDQVQFINTREEELFSEQKDDDEDGIGEDERGEDENGEDESEEDGIGEDDNKIWYTENEKHTNEKEDISSVLKNMNLINIDDI